MIDLRICDASTPSHYLRCTIAYCLLWLGSRILRAGAKTLPATHPARAFTLGRLNQSTKPVLDAAMFTPAGDRVAKRTVVSWIGVAATGLALFGAELVGATNMMWDGPLTFMMP